MAVYYVDSVDGDDGNAGTNPAAPIQTLAQLQALLADDDVAYLRRGCAWREQLDIDVDRVQLGAVGAGADPVIKGSDVIDPDDWSATATPSTATYVADTFARSDASSWGDSSSGADSSLTWTPHPSDTGSFSIASAVGVITKDSGGARSSIGDSHSGSVEVFGEFANVQTTSDNFGVSLLAYQSGTFSSFYLFGYRRSDGKALLYKRASSVDTLLGSATKTGWASVSVRGQITVLADGGRRLRLRVWQTGTSEPDTWDVDVTETAPVAGGNFGVYVYNTTASGDATIDNLAFKNSPAAFANTHQVALTGDPGDIVAEDDVLLSKQTTVEDVEANPGSYIWSSNVLYVHASDSSDPSSNGKTYETPTRPHCVLISGSSVTVERILVEHASDAGLKTHAGADTPEIRYIVARRNNQWGIYFSDDSGGGASPWAHHCTCYANKRFAGIGMRQSAGEGIVERNTVYSNGTDDFRDHGIYAIVNGAGRITIRWNTSYDNAAAGFKASTLSTNTRFYGNISYSNGRYGYAADGGSSGSRWYHNLDDGSRWGFTLFTDSGTITVDAFQNNVLINNTEYGVYNEGAGSGTITTLTNNLVWQSGTARYQGFVEDAAGINADPLVVSASRRDYRLHADSPCISGALAIDGLDWLTKGSTPDIGPLERGVLTLDRAATDSLVATPATTGSPTLTPS